MIRTLKRLLPERARAKTVLLIALPVMAAQLTQTFINLFDTIIIGYLPKEYSISGQAALGYSVILHWMVGGFVGAISVGTQAMAARRLGEGDRPGAGKVVFNSAVIAFTAGTVVTLLAMAFARPMFSLLTDNEQVLAQGVPYLRARFSAILAMVATLSFKSFFDGLGKTHYHLIAAIIMNVFNAVAAYALTFGALGFPQMYVEGAGIAASLASYLGLVVMIGWALKQQYRKDFHIFHWSNLDRGVIARIVRLSLPSGVATVAVMTGFLVFFVWVGMLDNTATETAVGLEGARLRWLHALMPVPVSAGTFDAWLKTQAPVYEAATKVLIDILSIAFMSCMGLGVATATLVSQSMGRREPEEAARYGWTAAKIAAWFTGLFGLAAALFPDTFMGLFSHDQEVLEVGRWPLRMLGAGTWMIGIGMVLAQALFGAGNTRFVMKVEITLHFVCLIPLSYFFGIVLGWKLVGIWLAALLYILFLALTMTLKFRSGTWKKIQI